MNSVSPAGPPDSTTPLYPLRFQPIYRRYVWGGRRLETAVGKTLPPGDDYAESWEICDRPEAQSIVHSGPLGGAALGELVSRRGRELLGRHHPQSRFPLLFKFLDAQQALSVQVHPDDERAARLDPPDAGKTEAWVVLEASPGSAIYAGLKPGIDRRAFEGALAAGDCSHLLNRFEPSVGDCIYLPAGTVHAIGAGLVIAEIQQPSDVTYRLFDWNRLGKDGQPRLLHIQAGLDATDFSLPPVRPQQPSATAEGHVSRLLACERFVLERWTIDRPRSMGGDDRCRILAVIEGQIRISGEPSGEALARGTVVMLPAGVGSVILTPDVAATLLCAYLP
jgi:mannose-6-phosphate isomerase